VRAEVGEAWMRTSPKFPQYSIGNHDWREVVARFKDLDKKTPWLKERGLVWNDRIVQVTVNYE